jgi:hypothetical protein
MMRPAGLSLILAATGCAGGGPKAEGVAVAASESGGEAYILQPLEAAALPKGDCGMILWTLDEDRPAPIFRYVAGKSAHIRIDGAAIELAPEGVGGGAFGFGVYERQRFLSGDGIKVEVEARFSLGFDGGSYLERGLVSVVSPDGWRSVAPAAGVAGCRSK